MSLTMLKVFLCSALATAPLLAATTFPTWYPGPNTTKQSYYFDTASFTPAPNINDNAYGTATTTITLGFAAAGWQQGGSEPDNMFLNGVTRDGAMDLGVSGMVSTNIKIASSLPSTGFTYRVEFFVYSVSYKDFTDLPELYTAGMTAESVVKTTDTVAVDPIFRGTWKSVSWSGYFDNVDATNINLGVIASNLGAVVDTYEIYTRTTVMAVPEPSTTFFLMSSMLLISSRRNRK